MATMRHRVGSLTMDAMASNREPPFSASQPQLLAVSHGTSSVSGHDAIAALVAAIATRLPATQVRGGYIDVEQPRLPQLLAQLTPGTPVVIVPLLLSAGYHLHVDLRQAARAGGAKVRLAKTLGPDRRLARILQLRLLESGYRRGDLVIMAAAGSSDARASRATELVAAQLAQELGDRVTLAYHSASSPTLKEAIAVARALAPARRIAISSYLLAPGYFQSLADNCEADIVSAAILSTATGAPPSLVEIAVERFSAAVAALPL